MAHALHAFPQHVAPQDVAVEIGAELPRSGVRTNTSFAPGLKLSFFASAGFTSG